MCTTGKWKTGIWVIALALVYGTANAQRWPRHSHPHRMVTIVVRPDVTSYINNRFNQKVRLAMAVGYLETNKYLTVNQYAKMTQLSMASAEAELIAFAMDKKKPIQLVIRGKKKVYEKRISYETDSEIISFRSSLYILDSIVYNRPAAPSSSQALYCRYAVDNQYGPIQPFSRRIPDTIRICRLWK